eukprot:TRINITY_DN6470_c0_g1_i1.p1 TRINITY_DN6470_c0_g1~~TRINITY_DN6470_c0_g1_i1.p1  ORF type:complete len:201 (-),score=33.98 TRINITY_DN6470_c0_g1_i1:37-639(-)
MFMQRLIIRSAARHLRKFPPIAQRNFFWGKSASKKKEKQEDEEPDISKMKSLNFLIEEIKNQNKSKPPLLPPRSPNHGNKLTVVLEMDEVLLHVFYPDEDEAYMHAPLRDYDYYTEYPEYSTYLSVYKREHYDEFLDYLAENCEPIIFSTGVKSYVDRVLDLADPKKVIKHRLYQDSCDKVVFPEAVSYTHLTLPTIYSV